MANFVAKLRAKMAKLKAKREKVLAKRNAVCRPVQTIPQTPKEESEMQKKIDNSTVLASLAIAAMIGVLALLVGGCAFERAEPAAKSARATYGAISQVASGAGATCSLMLGDGAFTAADGDGATAQTTKQASTQNPEFTGATDPISAGIQAVGKVATAGINAYTVTHSKSSDGAKADATKDAAQTAIESAVQGCEGGDCNYETGECEGPDCVYVE